MSILVGLILAAVVVWALEQFISIDPFLKKLIYVVMVVLLAIWLISLITGRGFSHAGFI